MQDIASNSIALDFCVVGLEAACCFAEMKLEGLTTQQLKLYVSFSSAYTSVDINKKHFSFIFITRRLYILTSDSVRQTVLAVPITDR